MQLEMPAGATCRRRLGHVLKRATHASRITGGSCSRQSTKRYVDHRAPVQDARRGGQFFRRQRRRSGFRDERYQPSGGSSMGSREILSMRKRSPARCCAPKTARFASSKAWSATIRKVSGRSISCYEAYETMALKKLEEIGIFVRQAWDIDSIAMIHRLGHLNIGETSVAVIITSAHRRASFDACHYAIDTLKKSRSDLEEGILRRRRGLDRRTKLTSERRSCDSDH